MVKNSPVNAGDTGVTGSIPGSGRSSGVVNGNSFSIPAWKIPWIQEPGRYSPWGHKESDTTEQLSTQVIEKVDTYLYTSLPNSKNRTTISVLLLVYKIDSIHIR